MWLTNLRQRMPPMKLIVFISFLWTVSLVEHVHSWSQLVFHQSRQYSIDVKASTTSRLFSTPSPKRQPRRNLQKRQHKRQRFGASVPAVITRPEEIDDFPWDTAETRPLVLSHARELGEDYWIDTNELQRYKQRMKQLRARDPGRISEEKLWKEVLSPYKQNWIGLISVSIVALAVIFKFVPEVIDPPMIINVPLTL